MSGAASTLQAFSVATASAAGAIARQQGLRLWPGTQPPFTPGTASMGPACGIAVRTDFLGRSFNSPPLETLQIFDLLDRGLSPDAAIAWMNGNGYPTAAAYYPSVAVIGFNAQYMALVGGSWELVLRPGRKTRAARSLRGEHEQMRRALNAVALHKVGVSEGPRRRALHLGRAAV